MASNQELLEAKQLWDWVQWRLPADLWLEAQQILRDSATPNPTTAPVIQVRDVLVNPASTRQQKLNALNNLLLAIRNGSMEDSPDA